jgi:hypothetical protein
MFLKKSYGRAYLSLPVCHTMHSSKFSFLPPSPPPPLPTPTCHHRWTSGGPPLIQGHSIECPNFKKKIKKIVVFINFSSFLSYLKFECPRFIGWMPKVELLGPPLWWTPPTGRHRTPPSQPYAGPPRDSALPPVAALLATTANSASASGTGHRPLTPHRHLPRPRRWLRPNLEPSITPSSAPPPSSAPLQLGWLQTPYLRQPGVGYVMSSTLPRYGYNRWPMSSCMALDPPGAQAICWGNLSGHGGEYVLGESISYIFKF